MRLDRLGPIHMRNDDDRGATDGNGQREIQSMSTEPSMGQPLRPVDFLVLLMLVDGPRHGYGILLDVESATEGDVRLDAGNLYRALRRFLDRGWVVRSARREAAESGDERRQYYRLTARGRSVATAEARRIEQLLRLPSTRELLGQPAEAP